MKVSKKEEDHFFIFMTTVTTLRNADTTAMAGAVTFVSHCSISVELTA